MSVPIKTAEEIEGMRRAGRMAASVLDMVAPRVEPGVTTEHLDELCHRYITEELGATPAPLNYRGFPKATCTSVNHVVCHGIPGPKKLKKGDILNIDVTVIDPEGWHGDTSRMFYVGEPSILARRLVETTRDCLWRGIEQVRPGATLGDIGHAVQCHAEEHNFSVVREYCGHGIGRSFHEEPQVLHYGQPGTGMRLEPGMTFTIEPMINAGKPATKLLRDQWTVVTKDRSLSAQWEHTLLVTETGYEILTPSPDGR
ncbi:MULTISPECIES: type I methionyl aminopeptidase [unclassified Halorhodospira]|uniref:type I methionyl aminopeptidase n=1 Tax=unclassified Halorhodospira TaxID=2626748 RepID=UPI001EE98B60|nr:MULTISPECIES: type I methionyl aminopeptidase [unclassified Halorhodospira]MCG5540466.1 type I methionyl aminopeptidase [Halorhodospira sp. M39old]MCG5545038.1 type I methionyl aminopeptidase [Halorhodospira sp. M38]